MSVWGSAFSKRLRPRSRLKISEWADKYRYIAPGTSPEPGPWRTDRVPYLREPMDVVGDHQTETVVLMWSSQVGKSEMLLNVIGYFADQEPAPQLMLQPTVEAAESFSKERIDPTFRYSPGLKNKLEEGKDGRGSSRKSSTTIRMKHYPGGYLALVGANSPAGLASRPIRIVLADEIDRYGVTKEGDPLKLAFQRATNFHNRKKLLVSTPTISGISKIEEWFLKSDQRRYYVPCPHCGASQTLKWAQVKWERATNGDHLPETAHYECEHCPGKIEDKHKHEMIKAGYWKADKPEIKGIVGFHLNSLYSPWVKLADLATEFVEATKNRDRKGLMEFINLKLGEPWVESQDDLDYEYLHKRREYYDADLPQGVLMLTAGVDTQDDRLEIEIVGWGKGRESWGVQYHVIWGDPGRDQIWRELDEFLNRQWTFEDGTALGITAACVDSGGHYTQEVYEYCKPRETRRIFAVRGKGGQGVPFIGKPTRGNRVGAALFNIGVDSGKANIMSRRKIEDEGPGYCHWPRGGRGYDQDYFKGLLSESLKFTYENGQTRVKWVKVHERNEPLDCRNYATAALEIVNPNFDWLEEQIQNGHVPANNPVATKKRKRVISRGVS
ncbi:MAG: phage terminase large subunit family protein [Methyloprofundus sp.]|nr:phage terminase large subunit family protein [Methyloprofundus sp.]